MCNGPIMRKLISFSVPLILSSMLQLLFNAVDIIVVGRFSGSQALAAVGSTTALINVFTNLFIGISLGANIITARYIGADRKKEVSATVHTSITVAILSGICMMILGILFAKAALLLMGTPDDVISLSTLYMRIYFAGMPFFMLYNYGAAILRAVGDTKRPLIFLIIAGVINALMNMFLVIVVHMGVAGVAIATIFSQMISCILVIRCLVNTNGSYRLSFSHLCIQKKYLVQILQVGVPAGMQSTLINFSNALLQSSVNSFGSVAMAGYTSANNILSFIYVAVNSITQACMSFTSQNYGVRKYDRMTRTLVDCLILECIVSAVFGSAAFFFGRQIIGIYTSDPAVIEAGMEVLAMTTLTYFFCGIMDVFPGSMRGMGFSTIPMLLALLGTVGTRVVWIFGFFPVHRTIRFLFISYPASWIITILFQLVYYIYIRKTKWKLA